MLESVVRYLSFHTREQKQEKTAVARVLNVTNDTEVDFV